MDEELAGLGNGAGIRNRHQNCKKAMKAAFARLMTAALSEGWTESEVAFFVAEVADDHIVKFFRTRAARPPE